MAGFVKRGIGKNVLEAAEERIRWVFDTFPRIYLSGPSGKDSGAMMHLVCLEARRRGRRVGVLYIDLEAQYQFTINHVAEMMELYADVIAPYWLAIPVHLRNATSNIEPQWIAWDPEAKSRWVRLPPRTAITTWEEFPWYEPIWQDGARRVAMEFEEIVEEFGHWYGGDQATACFVGIRTQESLNRWRSLTASKHTMEGMQWTTWKGRSVFNCYPIYDWRTEDVWTYFGRTGLPYNRVYDIMHQAGLSIHQQRICQPYGDDQRKGLHLFQVIEPKTWTKIVQRVAGANMGALYARSRGNILGNHKVTLPEGHTWESFAMFLLDSMPVEEAEHYRNKIAVFIHWWREKRGVEMIDQGDPAAESARKVPSWRRVCKVILKNDRCCKGLGFSPQRSSKTAYQKYLRVMKKRREKWGCL